MTYEEAFIYVIQGRRFISRVHGNKVYLLPSIDKDYSTSKIKCIDFLTKRNLDVEYFYVSNRTNLLSTDTFQENIKCL